MDLASGLGGSREHSLGTRTPATALHPGQRDSGVSPEGLEQRRWVQAQLASRTVGSTTGGGQGGMFWPQQEVA